VCILFPSAPLDRLHGPVPLVLSEGDVVYTLYHWAHLYMPVSIYNSQLFSSHFCTSNSLLNAIRKYMPITVVAWSKA
jgi:hypothetical protein